MIYSAVPTTAAPTTAMKTTAATEAPSESGGGGCFPSSATVKLVNQKSVSMSDLQIGDQVQTGRESVVMFILQKDFHV